VGDIPLELQTKLLRVLQEQEFERLGSTRTQRIDVRLLAPQMSASPKWEKKVPKRPLLSIEGVSD
jgi:transcriptional regulator with PAS, ATPase and Fis domain